MLFRLHAWRFRRPLHGLLPGGLPLGLGLGTLRLRRLWLRHARLWTLLFGLGALLGLGPLLFGLGPLRLRWRFGHALLRTLLLLLLLCPRRRGRRLLLELLPAYSLTGLVAIVAGANRPLLRYVPGIACT